MTLYDATQSFGRADDNRGLETAIQFGRSKWKATVIVLGLLMSLAVAEWFVTYCAFSNRCPAVQQAAELPASELQLIPNLQLLPQ